MEEDIKILEEYTEKDIPCDSCRYCGERPNVTKAVRNLIERNKELAHDNYILEKENKDFKTGNNFSKAQVKIVEEAIRLGATDAIKKEMKNFLPKQKVKEILENLKGHNYKCNFDDVNFLQNIIIEIQELLNEED